MLASLRRLTPLICFSLVALSLMDKYLLPPHLCKLPVQPPSGCSGLPLAFEQNVGQAAIGTDYLIRSGILLAS
jgi:hypothetical protein